MIIFHRVMGCKSDIFGFGTSDMISRKDIKPVSASFKNLDIFSLSATLTHNGSSVEGAIMVPPVFLALGTPKAQN